MTFRKKNSAKANVRNENLRAILLVNLHFTETDMTALAGLDTPLLAVQMYFPLVCLTTTTYLGIYSFCN